MRFGPPVQFVRRPDGHDLAYQVLGDAPLDLVFLFGWPTHLGLLWENPSLAGFLHKLGSFSRLILVDRLGNGLSDRGPAGRMFEDELDDVRVVLDAVGSRWPAFFGCHIGGRGRLCVHRPRHAQAQRGSRRLAAVRGGTRRTIAANHVVSTTQTRRGEVLLTH
jgi:hypothetical protein